MMLKLFCLAVVLANGESNRRVYAELPSSSEGVEITLQYLFPEDAEFNESCVSEGCPALNNFTLCSNDINITVLHAVLNTAVGCMRKPICGILIDSRPIPSVSMTTDQWLPGMEIYGILTLSGMDYLTNVSNTEIELLPNHSQTHQLPLHMALFTSKMRAIGNFKLDLSLRTLVPSILGQPLSFTIPRAKYDIKLQYLSTIFINRSLADNNYDIRMLSPVMKAEPVICRLDMPDGLPNILTLFTYMAKVFTDKSSFAIKKAVFVSKYLQSAIRTVPNSC